MTWSVIIFLLIFAITILFGFLVLSLNTDIIQLDLLFFELDVNIGTALLIFFLAGFLVTLTLEVIYFLTNRRKSDE